MKIKCAAIQRHGKVWEGKNHAEIIGKMIDEGIRAPVQTHGQGFVTECGVFVDRIEAAAIALKAGQIEKLKWPPLLYSEDLLFAKE